MTPLVPSGLTEEERASAERAFSARDPVRLPAGGWVQVADRDGRLKQQYAAARMDPLPDQRVSMEQPLAVLYGQNGRVVTMRSDKMTARVPKGELEEGRLEGNVVIRIYQPQEERPVDLAVDAADMIIETPEAEFNAQYGTVRVDRAVRVTSTALTGAWEGLTLRLSPDGKSIEQLVADRPLGPIRIERSAQLLRQREEGMRPAGAPAASATGSQGASAPRASTGRGSSASTAKSQGSAAPGSSASAASSGGDATAAPAASGGAGKGTGNSTGEAGVRLYLLTLHDDVRVVSIERESTVTMTGDQLQAVFLLKGEVAGGIARGDARPMDAWEGTQTRQPVRPAPRMADTAAEEEQETWYALHCMESSAPASSALAFAAPEDDAEEAIIITYAGKLELVPADRNVPALADPEGTRITMLGTPARVYDSRSQTTLSGARVGFESKVDTVELVGKGKDPARVENPDFAMAAPKLAFNSTTGKGNSQGGGTLRLGGDEGKPIHMDWGGAAHFIMVPGTSKQRDGTFRSAQFDGGVQVSGSDFRLESGTLLVESEPFADKDVPRRLVADGGVRATGLTEDEGRLEAGRVEVLLQPDDAGDARPRVLNATGGVMVADAVQTAWGESLKASFVAVSGSGSSKGSNGGRGRPGTGILAGEQAQLGGVAMDGPVQLLLKDGTRIWAQRLEGDAVARTAQLSGPNVLVVQGNSVMDQIAELYVQDSPAKLRAPGIGRLSHYGDRVIPVTRQRMDRPLLPQIPIMQATWRDGMAFADGVIPGKFGAPDRGLLLVQGAVKVRASRSPLEEESLDADEVQLESVPRVAQKGGGGTGRSLGASGGGDGADVEVRDMGQIATLAARGNVDIRAQRWQTPAKQGEPEYFRLRSQNATYDVAAGLCSVDGAGSILVNKPIAPGAAAPQQGNSPFAAEGVTRFTWQRSLGMRKVDEERTRIALDGSVEMQHVGAETAGGSGAAGTLLADHMEALVRRDGTREQPADGTMPDLGAGAVMEQVLARGRVLVRTAEYDIEAGELALDETTQVATMAATPGRMVQIQKRGAGSPQRAQSAVWDMKSGVITIEKLRGTISR